MQFSGLQWLRVARPRQNAATNKLTKAAQVIYQQAADEGTSAQPGADDVVDAEFEEVDDKDK